MVSFAKTVLKYLKAVIGSTSTNECDPVQMTQKFDFHTIFTCHEILFLMFFQMFKCKKSVLVHGSDLGHGV